MDLLVLNEDKTEAHLDPYLYEIEDFKAMIRRDKGMKGDHDGRKKLKTKKELAYIYHMNDYRSPYASVDSSVRYDKVVEDLFADYDWQPDEIVKKAEQKYNELTETHMTKLLKSARNATKKLEQFLNDVDLTERDDNGKPVYSAKDLIDNLTKLGQVSKGLDDLEEQVKKAMETQGKIKKQVEINEFNT